MHTHITHLHFLQVNRLLDDLVILWQLLTRGQDHENTAYLPATGVLVIHSHLPQSDHGTGELWVVRDYRLLGLLLRASTLQSTREGQGVWYSNWRNVFINEYLILLFVGMK